MIGRDLGECFHYSKPEFPGLPLCSLETPSKSWALQRIAGFSLLTCRANWNLLFSSSCCVSRGMERVAVMCWPFRCARSVRCNRGVFPAQPWPWHPRLLSFRVASQASPALYVIVILHSGDGKILLLSSELVTSQQKSAR